MNINVERLDVVQQSVDMPLDDDYDIHEEEYEEDEVKPYISLIEQRCKESGLAYKVTLPGEDFSHSVVTVDLPSKRDVYSLVIRSKEHAQKFLISELGKTQVLSGFQAFWNRETSIIEAGVTVTAPNSSLANPSLRIVMRLLERNYKSDEQGVFRVSQTIAGVIQTLAVHEESDSWGVIFNNSTVLENKRATLTIKGVDCQNHDDAISCLERASNSLFFSIASDAKVTFQLSRRTRRRIRILGGKKTVREMNFPAFEYDGAPMSLFWYGRMAQRLPLQQFLAFYQCVEYYFDYYAQGEAIKRVRNIIKDPSFHPQHDDSVNKVVKAVQKYAGRRFGAELSQLEAVIKGAVDIEVLAQFLSEDVERKGALSDKKTLKGVSVIPFNDRNADLHSAVAKRIYNIRCRIVHAKDVDDDGQTAPPLLPYTIEEGSLRYDIELIEFLAQRVLIDRSSEFKPL